MGASRRRSWTATLGMLLVAVGCAADDPDAHGFAGVGETLVDVPVERLQEPTETVSEPVISSDDVAIDDYGTLTQPGPVEDPAPCVSDLGVLSAGQFMAQGSTATAAECPDVGLGLLATDDAVPARWYRFTLDAYAWADFALEIAAGDAETSHVTLSLFSGQLDSREVVDETEAGGMKGVVSIDGVLLAPGPYALEVASTEPGVAVSHELTITVPVSGLEEDVVVAIDAMNTIQFEYWPPDAQVWVTSTEADASELTGFLRLGLAADNGRATIALSPGLASGFPFILTLTTGYETTSTRDSFSISYDVAGSYDFALDISDCGVGMKPSPHSGLCIADYSTPSESPSATEAESSVFPEDGSTDLIGPSPESGMRSALDAAPFGRSEYLASLRVSDVVDVSDLRVVPAAGDTIGPLFTPPDIDARVTAAMGRVFDLCDDDDAQEASRVDPYGVGRELPPEVMPADEFMALQRDRIFMSCDGSEPGAYIGYRYALVNAWGEMGWYQSEEHALESFRESQAAVSERYGNMLPRGQNAWGSLTAGHGIEFADRTAPVDEVRVLTETVAVRDGVLRGLVRNWSRRYFAYGTRVSAGDGMWHWPLSIQPGEVAPFAIEDWTGPQEPDQIEFDIDTEMSLEVDISRAWHVNEHPRSQWVEATDVDGWDYPLELAALLPQHGEFALPSVWAEPEYGSWRPFLNSSHPSLAQLTDLARIEDLRSYVALLDDYGGRVMDVQKAWPLVSGWLRDSELGAEAWRHLEANRFPFRPPAVEFRQESAFLDLIWYSPEPWVAFVWLGGAHPQVGS